MLLKKYRWKNLSGAESKAGVVLLLKILVLLKVSLEGS